MSKKAWYGVGAVILVLVAVVLVLNLKPTAPGTIKIGAVLPVTGQAAGYGKWMQRGIELAVEDVNTAGGIDGKQLQAIIEDSKSDNRAGVDAATKLISIDNVPAIVTVLTGVTKSIMPITERNRVILFTLALSPGLTEEGQFVFRNATNVANEVDAMMEVVLNDLELKKVALIFINNPAGLWVADYFKKTFEASGGTLTASESFQPDATDFRSQITKIKASNPDALYVLGYQQNGLIMKQARELGLQCQFLGASDCELPEVLRIAGNAADGTIYTKAAFDPASQTKEVAQFVVKYRQRYGEDPEVFGATSYDAVRIIAVALEQGKQDPARMRDVILTVKDYPGVSGQTTFLPNRDVKKPVEVKRIEGGKYVHYGR